tara:strand:- start:75 stop:1790 length:1716 start_codon:yes stop_codon:yes gene_type:complete
MAEKPTTKLDPATATVREVAVEYARRQGHENINDYVNAAVRYLGKYADQPGSAVDMFMPDEDGETKLSRTFKLLDEGGEKVAKDSMQVLRYVGTTIAQDLPPNSNILAFLPDVGPDTPRNVKIFGRKEPPKAVSGITIKTDRETMASMFRQIMEIAKDPKQEAAAMATLFNLQNGLRPNAAGMLQLESYYPETRAIYISAETKGAKGRRVNVPLNDIADTILQNRLEDAKKRGDGYFFVKQNGNPVKSPDITNILKQVIVPKLVFDPEGNDGKGAFYDSLAPKGDDVPGKRGSPLLRNIHTKIGQRNGISFERIAYLQGRSLKSAAEGSVGDIVTYASDYPGDLEPGGPDARNANVISTYFAEAAEGAGFDISSTIVPPEQRIGRTTPGYESYFEAPIVSSPINPTGDVKDAAISPELLEKLKKNPRRLAAYLNMLEAKGVDVSQYRNSAAIAALLSTLGGAAKAAMAPLPIIGFEGTRQEMLERGASPGEAIAQATAEELSGPMSIIGPVSRGLADAAVAGAEAGLEEQYGYKGPVTLEAIDKIGAGFISGGRFKFPNFASGGFIEKKGD